MPKNLRVLFVSNADGTGGGAAFAVCALMLDLKKRYNVEPVFLTTHETKFSELCRQNDIEVIIHNYYYWVRPSDKFIVRLKGRIKNLVNDFVISKRILGRLSNTHFDIIHTNSSITDMGDIISRRLSVPHVWHIRESGSWHYYASDRYVRRKHARAAANIMISQANYDFYVNHRKLCPSDNSRIIYNGLAVPAAYSKRLPDHEHIHFCLTGNFDPQKNQILVAQACEKLRALTDKFTLHFVGNDISDYAEIVKDFVHSHGLEDCVKFWGERWDVGEILHDMDVGLMPSLREGFGRVTVEYMLNYMPVIGTQAGATPEIVLDGETGFIVPLDDPDRMAQAMLKFITNPELIHLMGSKGRDRAEQNFSLQRNTDEIYSLYQEILSRR